MPCVSADVDDLKDIADLEEHIAESAIVLLFLSRGCMLQEHKPWLSESTPAGSIDRCLKSVRQISCP
jgi:hypothetical protein